MSDHQRILKDERTKAYTKILVGSLIGAVAYPTFLVPNAIAPGGLSGLAIILNHLFGTPVGTMSLLMNIPLFIVGYRAMGKIFAFRSLIATVLFSLLIDLIKLPALTQNPMLGCIFGGVLLGVGLGLILSGGATTGGSDMVARMVHARFQHITVGMFLFFIDFLVVVLAAFFIEMEYALYAFISLYVSAKLVDTVVQGWERQMACYIITPKYERVKRQIMVELARGVTLLSAEGGYTGRQQPMLLCILSAQEVARLKLIVREADETAFVFITSAHEVLGEGFSYKRP